MVPVGSPGRQRPAVAVERPKSTFPADLFQDFSKRELQDFLEVFHYSVSAESDDDINDVLIRVQKILPFEYLIAGSVRLKRSGEFGEFSNVVNVSYPNEWLYTYAKQGYANLDPVLVSLLNNFGTQIWEHTYESVHSRKQLEFIEEAKSYALTNGITTGAVQPNGRLATFFSFAGGEADDHPRYAGVLKYLGNHLHDALVRNNPPPALNYSKGLSPRELTVLSWMRLGKTNWEISRIIGVTERTVRFHVESIFIKLDVTSRTQAVAMAMETGLLTGNAAG